MKLAYLAVPVCLLWLLSFVGQKKWQIERRAFIGAVVSTTAIVGWLGIQWFRPPISIWEHWFLVLLNFIGGLACLAAIVSTWRSVRRALSIACAFTMAAVHFLATVVSIPVS